ncbi:MarR family winged helix-turn-helix transcriptional regulator [Sulfuricurvum sp.]|uniref:MarR family winged helix-turn-helix transcriptional regulator n=1 Tax=Sulfuricurvum sp. TaxID=2025608 RepID=UPI002639CD15|nr:MarR family winged helix-turn-helix transcriptional regulator [Sulfuricurvum sp.]MDD2266319.1 MarR family winged helix-turn-helix transcriptional regulator [Sulfuricurvum sp.]MDD2784743.1 MarR family winged helix-turn-helix transcriptional regulator [Sulfuricurvum sp.]
MSICFLSLETSKIFNQLILDELSHQGFDGLSNALIVLFPYIDEYKGISASALASKIGYTRQAMHKNLLKLETLGYILFETGENKKEKAVVLTQKGLELMKSATVFIENTQHELSELLGEKGLQEYMEYQSKVVSHLHSKKGM